MKAKTSRVAWVETHVATSAAARRMADAVVGARLAACANWARIDSLYWWGGKLERAAEVRVTFTTARGRVGALAAEVERLHPYEVPYISWGEGLQVPSAYAAWVNREAGGRRARSRSSPRPAARRTR